MRSRSNGGVIGAFAYPNQNYANGVFFIHDAAIYNTGLNPIWPLSTAGGLIYSASGGTIETANNDSNIRIHTFTANGTFTVTTGSAFLEIFMVGGGGAGGHAYTGSASYYHAGGGGGGGTVTLITNCWVNSGTTFTVEVGQGAPQTTYTSGAANGKPSKITSTAGHSFISPGGGAGWSTSAFATAIAGGNGGGAHAAQYQASFTASAAASAGSGSPGTVTSTGYRGADGYPNVNARLGGGGAGGVSDGYSGVYSFNTALQGFGGDGYFYARKNCYFGSGGGGGQVTTWPGNGRSGAPSSGLSGPSPGTRLLAGYASSTSGSVGAGSDATATYGGGGGGGAVAGTTSQFGYGGAGGSGMIVFCYRYK